MSNEMKLVCANEILQNYNIELRYAKYKFDEPNTAVLVVKDRNKDVKIGLICLSCEQIIKFFVGNISFTTISFEESEKMRREIETLYKDIDSLNKMALPSTQED